MSRRARGSGPHFKRIISHTSTNGGNTATQRQNINENAKKVIKSKTAAPDSDHHCGNSYKVCPDCEPLLNNHLSTSPTDIPRNDKSTKRIKPQFKVPCGHLSPLDFRQDCPHGIMSVTDIELTMGDEDITGTNLLPPGSPMNDYMSTSSNPSNLCSPLVRCTKVSCDENICLWHRCVLKLPQHVRWEDRIVTIELQRNDGESFGFNYKSKRHLGKDEIYTLVSRIDENSKAAKSGLALGDLILSANNVAMQTQQKVPDIDLSSQRKLRLLIQHPLEISSKAASHVEQLRASMSEVSSRSNSLSQPPTPSTSPPSTLLSPPGENIPLNPISKPETKSKSCYHQLPQVRVFVCGNATNEFIQCLIGDSITAYHDESPRCIQISMKKSAEGIVSISNSESFSYLFENSSEPSINVELVTVPDDRFFHHCCSWMLTQNSVFILTFDTNRLSHSSESEMFHLCNLAHTVQTGISGECSNLKLYGITSAGDSINPEEVQTLFYTPLGNSLPDPKVIPLFKGALSEEMKQIRQDIFSLFNQICDRQKVIYPTAIALDMLVSQRRLIITKKDLAKTLEDWNLDSKEVGPESLCRVVEDLINTGNLIVTASLNAACVSEDLKEFVLPCILFDHLSRLVLCTELDRVSVKHQNIWTTLCSTGIITRPEFIDILAACMSDPQKVLCCMEDLRLVYPVRILGQDSGLGQDDSLLFPYYLQDVSANSQADNYGHYMTIDFSANIPVSTFYLLLSELSQCDHCYTFKMKAQFIGHMILHTNDLCFYFKKTNRQILVFRNRLGPPSQHEGKQTVPQQIQQVLTQQIPGNVQIKVRLFSEETETNTTNVNVRREEKEAGEETCVKDAESFSINISNGASALPNVQRFPPHFPIGLIVDEVPPRDARRHKLNDVDRAQQNVLDMNMLELRHIYNELFEIFRYVSVSGILEELAGECGLTYAEMRLYESMIKNQPSKLPGQTFLETYWKENCVTLRDFLQILCRMVEQHRHYCLDEMVKNLYEASLRGNTHFAGNSQNPSW